MNRLFVVLIIEAITLLPALAVFLTTPANFSTLGALLVLFPIAVICAGIGLVEFRHRARRKLAAAVAILPIIVIATPFVFDFFKLDPVPAYVLWLFCVAILLCLVTVLATRQKFWRQSGVFASRSFHIKLLVFLLIAIALLIVPVIVWLVAGQPGHWAPHYSGRSTLREAFLLYYAAMAIPCIGFFLAGAIIGGVGLVKAEGMRLYSACELLLTMLLGATIAGFIILMGLALINPG